MSQTSIRKVEQLISSLSQQNPHKQGLFALIEEQITSATSDAVYGPYNPFQDLDTREAYCIMKFESGIAKLLLELDVFAGKTLIAREKIAKAFESYSDNQHHLEGSALIQTHFDHAQNYGLPLHNLAQLEVAAALGVLSNIVPTTFWLLYHLYSSPSALSSCRSEIEKTTMSFTNERGNQVRVIDISKVKLNCSTLLSCFKETLRLHTVGASARMVMEDTTLASTYTLKQGGLVLLPQQVLHSDKLIWGSDADSFCRTRFLRGTTKRDPVAFQGFGGGTTLYPGRHFARTEVLAYTAMFIMQFDMYPEGGCWLQPTTNKAGMRTVTPGPDAEVNVIIHLRGDTNLPAAWQLSLSKSNHVMELVAEDNGSRTPLG